MVLVWYTVKKSSGNLREQVKSYSYIVVCTFKLQTNRSLKLQIIMQKLLSKISRIFFYSDIFFRCASCSKKSWTVSTECAVQCNEIART